MKKVLSLLLISLVTFSCNPPASHPEEDPPENPDAVLAEEDIGSSGGVIEAEGIALTIPPGSFSELVTVRIFPSAESDNVYNNVITGLYRIEGLPGNFSKPVEFAIKYAGSLANESYLALGQEVEVLESEGSASSNALFEARDSSGYLVSSLEPPLTGMVTEGPVKKGTSSLLSTFTLMGLSNMTSIETPYFRLVHEFQSERQKIRLLADHMDAAIDTFASMNLISTSYAQDAIREFGKPKVSIYGKNNERYRGWFIDMPEFKMETENFPPSYSAMIWESLLRTRFSLSEQVLIASSENEIAGLAYAMVYRMCCFNQVGSRQDWFTYGSALWIQEKYSGVAGYKVTTSPLFSMSPLMGMESAKTRFSDTRKARSAFGGILTVEEGNYGHSMVPLIKYLDLKYNQDKKLIVKILAETILSKPATATEGIINAMEDTEYLWFPGFYKAYLNRELYNISFAHFEDEIRTLDQVNIYHESDTTFSNEENYPDLSARLFKVNFLMSEIKEEAALNLKLGPPGLNLDYVSAMAFGLKDGELEYLNHANDVTLSNLSELVQNGYRSIVVAVINSANEPPFNENTGILLETKLRIAPKDFEWVILKVKARSMFNFTVGSPGLGEVVYTDGKLRTGQMTGNKFTASWSEPLSDGTSSGTLEITFDMDRFPRYITGYSVTETQQLSSKRIYNIAGDNIELWGYKDIGGTYVYYMNGKGVEDYITYIDETYSASDGYGYSTDGVPVTDDGSYIEIRMGRF